VVQSPAVTRVGFFYYYAQIGPDVYPVSYSGRNVELSRWVK